MTLWKGKTTLRHGATITLRTVVDDGSNTPDRTRIRCGGCHEINQQTD
jgi:hypothetical protein